ncbi:hypothetical protein PAPYR_8691 [Paratrimastix pyriformis]|uniref:N-acetyltransferase domain-containing protein n=1 Tax=Paratrimastix pyriformis TaxID=342808 RepID=A0ABQ8UA30_9EUKA|nr:hypothetical protein PAPYR_8691 [Paratrimastix pyriformis]
MQPELTLQWITEAENPELYAGMLDVRYETLRKPLGMPRSLARNDLDPLHSYHLVCFDSSLPERPVLGCVSLHTVDHVRFPGAGKLYQMAVRADQQKLGVGRKLVIRLLEFAKDQLHLPRVYCHARHYASGFYERCGFCKTPEVAPFEEVGMKHFCMHTDLCLSMN